MTVDHRSTSNPLAAPPAEVNQPAVHADLLNKDYCDWVSFLRQSDGWSREQIAAYQLAELRRIIKHAFDNTKGYRKLFTDAGIAPEAVESLEDVRRLPFVEKEMIRDTLEDFTAEVGEKSYVTTGGSTGIPFGMYREPKAFARELASKAHQYHRIGWREGDPQFVFRGLPIETDDHMQFVPEFNELRASSYHLTPEWMEVFRQRAIEYGPQWLRCYPSSGYIFARFIKETGREFPPIKGILCASENLYDFQKELLREAFKTRVFSHYGHYELAALAGFCEHEDTYHVLPQYGHAELIGKDGQPVTEPGGTGEIVATSFILHATPFIRYRTRDFAVLKAWECKACGRPYQIWDKIEGRLQEFIITGTGRYISMTAVNMHSDIFDAIKQFQFYQEEKGRLVFKYLPREDCDERAVELMKEKLLVKLGDDVDLQMEPVREIPLTKRGKHRFLVQKLPVKYGDV